MPLSAFFSFFRTSGVTKFQDLYPSKNSLIPEIEILNLGIHASRNILQFWSAIDVDQNIRKNIQNLTLYSL